tara:strand:+ start:58 stop:789 length:732 start_codon:yes stop_codon:yes gene_type:complete
MNIYFVSDVHIKEDNDEASVLFRKFLKEAYKSDAVILLGDIFDLIVGGHQNWFDKFPKTFQEISKLSQSTKVYYIEGNHDFLMQELFKQKLEKVTHISGDLVLKSHEKSIRFSHGDDVEIENMNYRIYKKLINNQFIEFLANKVVPVKVVSMIGDKASKESAKKSRRYSMSEEYESKIKEKFRQSAEAYFKKLNDFNILACGHSHVKDMWNEGQFTYVNNGYFMKEKTYATIEDGVISFKNLV